MADLTYSININTRQALGGIKQLQQQLNKTDKAVKKVDKSAQGFGSSLGGLKTILAGVVSGAALKGIIDTTARFEDLRTTLGSVFGSAQKGAQAFEAIQNLSTKTQFGIEDLSNTFIKLAGAGIQPTEKLLQTFTDTAAVTTDQVGTLNAMTDLLSRTTQGGLGLEELNRLGDRGIPVFEILAEKLGITRNEISEFGKSAEGARKITEALAEGLDERFGGATADRLGNISTLMSNFSIAVKNAAGQVGEAMKPALSSLILTVTEFIEKNKDLAETIGTVLGSALNGVQFLLQLMADNAKLVGSAVVGLTAALGAKGLASALTAATAGFNLLKNAMKTNPFGLLAIGIATLIAYLSFENGLGRTFVQIKAAVDVLGKAFGRFTSFLADKVGGVVTWLKDRFFDFIQVLIDSYNAIARIIPGLDEVSSSARELGDVVSAGVGDALDYAAGKAGEMKDAIVAAIPPEVLAQYDELKTAVREAGETYDELKEKSKQAGETIAGVTQIPEIKAGGVVIDKKQSKEEVANAKKLENSMKGLTDRLLPLKAAKEKYKQETELLNRALLEGKITTTEFGIAMTNLNKEYQDFLDSNSEGTKTWMDGWREATDEYVKRARDASSNAKELFSTATQGMEDAIVGFVKTGKLSFKSLMSDIAEQILRSQIRQLMGNLFGGGGSGGGSNIFSSIGKLFGGFFANGGFLPAGQVGIVGEKGPELISGPANITPMTGTNVTYNINAVDAPSFQDLVARDPSFIHAVSMQGARSI
jgi:phage tail tape-measure protein